MYYCTLFNSHYLSRGLALYESLRKCCPDFHLYIFAFDQKAFEILTLLKLPQTTIVSLAEFETPALLAVKPTRTIAEYCWTCTSSVILHCLEKYQLPAVCYLDADLFFWQDPNILIDEAKDYSILLTEHRYTQEYDHAAVSGKYCVQFMYFKNDENGMEALKWWRAACLEWCYNRVEPGRFGDQKYLDDWLVRFKKVKVLEHLGGGVAPWNVQQYKIACPEDPKLIELATNKESDLVFYHFHALGFINNYVDFGGYKLSSQVKQSLYKTYVKTLLAIEVMLHQTQGLQDLLKGLNIHCQKEQSFSWITMLKKLKNKLTGFNNQYPLTDFRG